MHDYQKIDPGIIDHNEGHLESGIAWGWSAMDTGYWEAHFGANSTSGHADNKAEAKQAALKWLDEVQAERRRESENPIFVPVVLTDLEAVAVKSAAAAVITSFPGGGMGLLRVDHPLITGAMKIEDAWKKAKGKT